MRWRRMLTVVGAHAEGEIGNVVIGGVVNVPGNSMFDKKRYLEHEADEIRRLLLLEPRGAPYNNTNIILVKKNFLREFQRVVKRQQLGFRMVGRDCVSAKRSNICKMIS